MSEPGWEFAFVLHNLVLPDEPDPDDARDWPNGLSIAPEHIRIVRHSDPAVVSIRQANPATDQLLAAFHDERGDPYAPAVLLVNRATPERIRHNLEAFVCFRNAIALTIVLRGRAALARGHQGLDPLWSDTFDFHPAKLGRRGQLLIESPALRSWVSGGRVTTARPKSA